MVFKRELLDFIVCPLSRTRLLYDEKNQELVSHVSNVAYPIRDGIPILVTEEARSLEVSEKTSFLNDARFSEISTSDER